MASSIPRLNAERAEVDLLLKSRTFGRANSLGRFLSFVCEKYFAGATSEIKEYNIAVEALGRPPDFDPQTDTIVRVTAHTLRKRLEAYYSAEGADHEVQISLPPGHYMPLFTYRVASGANGANGSRKENTERQRNVQSSAGRLRPRRVGRGVSAVTVTLTVALAVASYYWVARRSGAKSFPTAAAAVPFNSAAPGLHAMVGSHAQFVDRAGSVWEPDRFCSGGAEFSVIGHSILGTGDSELYSAGRRGQFQCSYPVAAGVYEVHLLFAETAGLQENSRSVGFSINGGPVNTLDVVDDAGGDDIATAKVLTDISPAKDGMIHVDFTTPDSFVNGIEILPGSPHRMLPVRILAARNSYRDSDGNLWLSDRYFQGGRLSRFGGDLSKVPNGGIYDGHRFGHFRYIIPVAKGEKYTVRLHFLEHWFGVPSGSMGGSGSRVFSVWCNGAVLLRNFDIYQEGGAQPVVKTFSHIEPTAQDKIELSFTPTVNYPSVSAIEVIPE
ncbi:MAG TPA: malectin domain-containing carbohydrate-binding protein [Candidatus Sulfotelmatobacter sp.]|nr:malectin domain-containing carbohydrate-binding protein [Candidatus Sulfotelmatobacter sp.]